MADEVDIECPGCNAVFGVPVELCGETAQCAECETVFEIPTLDEDEGDGKLTSTDTGAIKGVETDGDATNTVRLSRTGIGMIPQLRDDFSLGGGSAAPPQSPKAPSGPPKKRFSTSPSPAAPSAPSAPKKSSHASAPAPAAAKVKIPSWMKVRLMKHEDVYGVREEAKTPIGAAMMALLFALGSGVAGIFLESNLAMAAVAIVVVSALSFIIVLLIAKSGARKALVLTSKRAICVVGGHRLEVKK